MMPSYIIIILCSLFYITSQNVLPAKAAIDGSALLSLKDKLTNGNPEALPSWNDSVHFCKWQGVSCNLRHMRVSALNLSNQNLGGTLSPAIGNLTFLKLLNLSCNGLRGRIPKQIGNLKRLLSLDLRKNYLEGQVPIELANCSKLQHVVFNLNNLTGEIPSWFGSMRQLRVLKLGVNKFHGTIPSSLGNLSFLESLSLSFNNLEGSIPQSLGRLSNLYLLYLGYNNLSGIIPSSLYNLSRMQDLSLGFNCLSGTLLSNIGLAFPNLQKLHVGHNTLTGTIPASISNMSQLQLFAVYENDIRGLVPTSLGRLQNLRRFEVYTNNLGGEEGHDQDFLSSLTNCSQLHIIEMWDNKFECILPSSIGNLSQLESLSMGSNRIFGSIPDEIGQLDRLSFLHLGNNFLDHTIPYSIGNLENLGALIIKQNQLSGGIPDIFENLTKLVVLALFHNHLEGAIPVSLKHCKGLQFLYINQNNLSGNLPYITFGGLESLIDLDMSSNSLNGPIPSEIGNMKQLVQLGLNENNFYGEIPTELGECIQLTYLNMRGNTIQGIIPSSFSSLKSLITLDISNNNLSGTIPQVLKDFRILETLNLSHNHFYGEVPEGGVFDNITAISLIGNENLCGGIPQLKLPKCPSKSKKHFTVIILIIVIGTALTCSTAVYLIFIYRRSKHKKSHSSQSSPQNTYLRVSYKELHDATNEFSSSNLVGVGSFCSVYKGALQHFERPIAVKVLNLQARGATKSFIRECKTLSKICHRNLLKILTSCSSVDYKGNDFKALVFEFMSNGSLENWLSMNKPGESRNLRMNFRQRLDVAIDIAHALDYLHHNFEKTIVHCDIKPSNILLSDDMVARLGDFGLARLLHEVTSTSREGQTTSSVIKGTIGYIPPEYGESGEVTTQGDVYSYGVLMLEMLTGKKPTDNIFHEDLSLPKFCKLALPNTVLDIVDPSLLVLSNGDHSKIMQNSDLENNIQECFASFARIGVSCCAELPYERMGIKDVLGELLSIKQKLSTFNIVI